MMMRLFDYGSLNFPLAENLDEIGLFRISVYSDYLYEKRLHKL